jgi:hypothetical protein
LENERVRTDLPTCIEKLRAPASRLRERSRHVMATKTNRPDRRPVKTAPLFRRSWSWLYQLPAAALSRTTTNMRCG